MKVALFVDEVQDLLGRGGPSASLLGQLKICGHTSAWPSFSLVVRGLHVSTLSTALSINNDPRGAHIATSSPSKKHNYTQPSLLTRHATYLTCPVTH